MTAEKKYTPHVHAEVIKAWADGKPIEARHAPHREWEPVESPRWNPLWQYRVKPEEVVDYTVVFSNSVVGANYFPSTDRAVTYYVNSLDNFQGYCKRTTIDGKVVALEFIPVKPNFNNLVI